jgi:hypothetical protein
VRSCRPVLLETITGGAPTTPVGLSMARGGRGCSVGARMLSTPDGFTPSRLDSHRSLDLVAVDEMHPHALDLGIRGPRQMDAGGSWRTYIVTLAGC